MELDTTSIVTLVGTIAATLGGKEAWSYYKKKLDLKAKMKKASTAGEADLQDTIKTMLEKQISELKDQVKELTTRIKKMEDERIVDKKRIANQEIKIAILSERLGKKFKSTGKKVDKTLDNPHDDIPTID